VRYSRVLAITVLLNSLVFAAGTGSAPVARWAAGAPNCTFRQGDDGRTYYAISAGETEITLAVDSQELEKIPHRAIPMFGVLLTFRYSGSGQLQIQPHRFAVEFVKHFQILKRSLDPDDLLQHLQDDVDDLTDEVERHQLRKHPEKREQKEAELQARLKDYTEMMDFISTRALRSAVLNPSDSSATGWVFFGIKDRWIGPWRKPEQFVLRLPLEKVIVEFPFSLPPQGGKVELRHRPAQQPR
jgi:hypothetical protein